MAMVINFRKGQIVEKRQEPHGIIFTVSKNAQETCNPKRER